MNKQAGSIRVMGGSGYKISLVIIAVLAVAMMVFMLIILPAVDEVPKSERRVISIEYPQGEMGIGVDLDKIHVRVSYSDGFTASVALSDMLYEGLDLQKEGQQLVSLTYGGFEQVLPIEIKSVDCRLQYQASTGGLVEGETTQTVPTGEDGNRVIARAEVGYIFVNWSDGNPNPGRRDTNVNSNKTMIANFEKARYIVVFRFPDGTVAREQMVTYNETPTQVPVPSDPKMQVYGYVFDRWALPFTNVTQDMTIDPVFVKRATDVSVDITKNNKGEILGTVDTPRQGYYPKGKEATLRANPMQARSFAGWEIKRYDGTWESITVADIKRLDNFKVVDIGTQGNSITFEAGQTGDTKEYYLIFTPNSETNLIELRANFVYDSSTITFINSMSSNTGNIEKTINLPNGEEIGGNISEPVGTGLGYSFVGWFREKNNPVDLDGNQIPVQSYDIFTQPATLVARWQKVYCEVSFLKGDGNLPQKTVYVLYQNTLASAVESAVYINPVSVDGIPAQKPTRENYIFVGWYLVGSGNILTDVAIDEDYKVYENINVRPKFLPIEHKLSISMEGAGRTQKRNVTANGVFDEVSPGNNAVQQTNQYIYRFTSNPGYQIKSIDLNGTITNYSGNVEWVDIEVYFPSRDMYVNIIFIPKTYLITIQNGMLSDAGNIRFQEKDGELMVERTSSTSVIYMYMEHNTSRNIYISALDTHFVQSVSIGDNAVINIPSGASEYTLVLDVDTITQDTIIAIHYTPFAYEIEIDENAFVEINEVEYDAVNDTYSYVAKNSNYTFGESPMFMFEAIAGYYIKGLNINGKNVDLYSPDLGININNIIVNKNIEQTQSGYTDIKDARVTDFLFIIENINESYDIIPLYERLYYDINVSQIGRGELDLEYIRVEYNESIQVHAETDGGYYVSRYTLNGETFVFGDMLEIQTMDFTNITNDIDLVVEFSIAKYVIAFDGSSSGGRYSTVRFEAEQPKPLNASYNAEHNSSNKFIIEANTGYYISAIIINGNEMVIADGISEQSLQIDNVNRSYHIQVNCEKIKFIVRARVNNTNYGAVTNSMIVNYGENAIFTLSYTEGYKLKSISEGELSDGNTKLTISQVYQDKLIDIEFEAIVYTVSALPATNGSITLSSNSIKYGEKVYVQIDAFAGYVVESLTINEITNTYTEMYENINTYIDAEQNITISATFRIGIFENPTEVTITQSGGTVNGNSGTFVTTVYDSVFQTINIVAPMDFYIQDITGEVMIGASTSYDLVLDGGLTEISVVYAPLQYELAIVSPITNGSANVVVSDQPTTGFVPATSASVGQYIRIILSPDVGYTLDKIIINGLVAANYVGENNIYTYNEFRSNQDIEISYKLIQQNITTEVTGGYGIISTDKNTFEYGKKLTIKIIPAIGYEVSTIMINGTAITGQEEIATKATQKYEIAAGSAWSKTDLLIRVSFVQIYHRVNIEIIGSGRIDQANYNEIAYGEMFFVDITADEHNFIQAIEIDGISAEIDNTNLQNYTFDNTTQKYIAGRYRLLVTKDLQVKIYFKNNIYRITLLPSVNGETSINLMAEGTGSAALDITSVEHGKSIQISMEASEGYNISNLYINSVEIVGFKHDNVNPNNNRLINFIYSGTNGQGIGTNILIRVDYKINNYKFQFQMVNESPNFHEFDILSASYGTISVLGNYSLNGNIYSGIPHGENFRLSINPVREKGYVISGLTITYIDPTSETQALVTIKPQVGGVGATILRTGTTLFYSQLMGQYASAMVSDVQLIQIRFTKETFSYDQEVVTAASTGTIVTRFYHPNDSTRAYTVGSIEPSTLILVDNKYEFGLGYTVSITPSAGHTRTAFYYLVGGAIIDRNSSVRANVYNSILQTNVSAKVEYVVNRYNINFSYMVYNASNTLINNPGTSFSSIRLEVGDDISVEPTLGTMITYLDCAYGTNLNFVLLPNYAEKGYYIFSLSIGSQYIQNFAKNIDEYEFMRVMGDGVLNVSVVFRINTYKVNDVKGVSNSVVIETAGEVPWGGSSTLQVITDPGYNLVSLEVYQNGEWTASTVKSGINKYGQTRDYIEITNIKEEIFVRATYERKEYKITVVINDKAKGDIRVDIIGNTYPNETDIPQSYTEKIEYREEMVYDPILDDYFWGTAEYRWDICSMDAKHYDEITVYLMPNNGYRVKELVGETIQYDKVKVALYRYVNGNRVPYLDNVGNPIIYVINTLMWSLENPDYRRFTLPTGVKISSDIEFEINFVIKDYPITIAKNPTSLAGVSNSILVVEKDENGDLTELVDGSVLNHFENIKITLSPVYGLSLDKMRINGRTIPYTSYTCTNNVYKYEFELEINDQLLNGLSTISIDAQLRRNIYNIDIEIYDNKSNQTTIGSVAPTLTVNTVTIITHGNTLIVTPVLAEGYSIIAIIINGQNYSTQIGNMNAQFGLNVAGTLVDSLDVHDATNDTLNFYFITAIDLHISSIRGFVYELGVDNYSDIAGDTTSVYNPADTMVMVGGVVKYEYFTEVTVSAVAKSTPEKTYRFAYYQEQVGSGWQTARDGERGITLSGENNSVMNYKIKVDRANNINGDRYFRAVYFRVLTVSVTVMPPYKYVSGYHTTDTLKYLQYLTVSATVGTNTIEDKNSENAWIYQQANQTGTIPYVETYIYHIDSGSFLKLAARDNDPRNLSSTGFYDKESNTAYQIINNITTTGTRIEQDRDIYLIARNQTMMSFDIDTIENESGINGGTLTWSIKNFDNVIQPATVYRGSMNSAKVLDTVTITVKATTNYRFTGMYLKNIDYEKTEQKGELVFKSEGDVGEWSWIDSSSDLITISTDNQGNKVYTIFVVSNMVMKFEFYRTFKIKYGVDYQDKGVGSGNVIKDEDASTPPIYTYMSGGNVDYEIYDYNSQIKLVAPATNEDYQFIGWTVNGTNIYKNLELLFPDTSMFTYWFKLYQNSEAKSVYDGLNLKVGGSDLYELTFIAIYQPIYKVTIINESYFYHSGDDHWNSWIPSVNLNMKFYEYFTMSEVLNGESGGKEYALAAIQENKSIYLDEMPCNIMDAYNSKIPARAISSQYDNTNPVWSQIRNVVDSNQAASWGTREVYTTTKYYKMMLEQLTNPSQQYDNWTDNILYLETHLSEGMALVEWQYYNWNTGNFEEIPYVSNPIYNNQGVLIGYTNNAKRDAYTINLKNSTFIDHTKPFVIRPLYNKRVTLTLGKKAYYYYDGDASTNGNAAQTPEILNSPGTATEGTFDYYTKCLIIPREGLGYRFIGWYINAFQDILDGTLIQTVVPGEATIAWQVHLKFNFTDEQQNNRFIHGRYIKQWQMTVESLNIGGGTYVRYDAPKLDLILSSLPTDTRCYELHEVTGDGAAWKIDITIDAGLHFTINMDTTNVGSGTVQGFNKQFDKQYDYTPFRLNDGEDIPSFNGAGDITSMCLYSCANRTLRIRYESFGEIVFTDLMWYAGIRLTDIMAGYIKSRFPGEFDPIAPIVILDEDDGVIDGKASFNRIPIGEVNYLGTSSSLTYDYVPYGYSLEEDRSIKVSSIRLGNGSSGTDYIYSHFNSRNAELRKHVEISYQYYKLFGIEKKTEKPGTASNPYLIGSNVNNWATLTSITEARQQFRNIEVFFDSNGASTAGVYYKLMQDIHLNNVSSDPTTINQMKNSQNWVPICSKYGNGFDGVLLGNGKILRSLYVDGAESSFIPYSAQALPESTNMTPYNYLEYGYGVFSSIKNGTITNLKLGTASINVDILKDANNNNGPGISNNVGYLAARISGENTNINNISIVTTFAGGYSPGYNIFISASTASNIGVIGGSAIGGTVYIQNVEVLKAKIETIALSGNIMIRGASNIGNVVGSMNKMISTNVTKTSGTTTIEGYNTGLGGMFGIVTDCLISNSSISSTYYIGLASSNFVGGFVGMINAGDFGCLIQNCYVTGNASSYVMAVRTGNAGTNADAGNSNGTAGGFAGYNRSGTIDNCSIRGTIKLFGYYCGGIIGANSGTVKNCVLNVPASGNDFNVIIESPKITNGGYGIIAGANLFTVVGTTNYNGLITDCGVIGPNVAMNTGYNTTNTRLYVYAEGDTSSFTPSIDDKGAATTTKQDGYTSIGGVVGLNQGRVFNSYLRKIKILSKKNNVPPFYFHMGGVVGFNDVGSITQGRGVSSCFSDGNMFRLTNILWADSASGTAGIGLGGVAGGSKAMNVSSSTSASHFSIRYCYAINNDFKVYTATYGQATNVENVFDGYWWFDNNVPAYNETKLNINLGLVVGGATQTMSRAYYSWGAAQYVSPTNWKGMTDVYGSDYNNLSESLGSVLRDGPSNQTLIKNGTNIGNLTSAYGTSRYQNRDNNYYGRTLLLTTTSTYVNFSWMLPDYPFPDGDNPGENRPTYCGGFVGGNTVVQVSDSRVIRTNEAGALLHTIDYSDWDNGDYVGSTSYATILTYLVPNQTKYTYTHNW